MGSLGAESPNGAPAVDVDALAVLPNAAEKVPSLVSEISSRGTGIALDNAKDRLELLETARSLVRALETPREALLRYCWREPASFAAIMFTLNLGVFALLPATGSPKKAQELAEATKADPKLLSRMLKHLAATGVLAETGPDEYRGTNFSTAMGVERFSDTFPVFANGLNPAIAKIPDFFKEAQYQSPSKLTTTPFNVAHATDKNFFEFLKEQPHVVKQFANHMSTYHLGRPSWMDSGFYPVEEGLVADQDIKGDDVLLIDIGGSTGHDLSEFSRKWPSVPGRLILQDLPEVVAEAKKMDLPSSIEPMPYNFFTEQPVKGARAYYMHSVLHDWPDDDCRKILSNITPAMKPGYSKILINENVIPETNAHWETTSLDFVMMTVNSTERTARDWKVLVESVGLKIVKIWTVRRGVESLIECELA
ncbi:o-methyltransferase [Penicillium alfredii]|uniref:O-methyltransferase n=1 Tax=Penicillium alfredii TaxID=1506179 RepID=A0A9W9F8C1_9EURO|nr:o-methyltransferase [Penicillium alfredii]KAJ5095481.1 o-methyltransferase [Penicillium alfredii]